MANSHVDRLQTDKHKVGSLDEHIANLPSSEIPRRGLQRADVILIYLQGRIIIAIQRAFVSGFARLRRRPGSSLLVSVGVWVLGLRALAGSNI